MEKRCVHRRHCDSAAQRLRQTQAACGPAGIQFHDRSVFCTAALARYLGFPVTETLARELARIKAKSVFQPRVFFVQSLGFVAPTPARRISYEDALRFERIHEETYRDFGFEIILVEPGSLADRVAAIKTSIN